jgi:NAD-dependent deacetylase sirtuin 5
MPPSTDMAAFQACLARAKHIIAIAGAGLSAASGIPTFRGAGGMWRQHDAMSLATPRAFAADPSTVWQFYHMRRETYTPLSPWWSLGLTAAQGAQGPAKRGAPRARAV